MRADDNQDCAKLESDELAVDDDNVTSVERVILFCFYSEFEFVLMNLNLFLVFSCIIIN
jgi:hypothetical protein